ncbi:MAG: S8 family serine peptidase [Phycisphaerales bacterium]
MLTRLVAGATLVAAAAMPAFAADAGAITPRTPYPKTPTDRLVIPRDVNGKVVATGRLIVKFHDSVQARASRAATTHVVSLASEDLSPVDEILARHHVTIRQALNRDPAKIKALENKVRDQSRRAQPDLAAMMFVEGPLDVLETVAKELNPLPLVEWVEFEQEMTTSAPKPEPAPTPAPMPGEDPSCTNSMQDCYMPGDAPFCSDFACCTLVGTIDPGCVNLDFGQWDAFCADLANLFCDMGDKCNTPLTNGGCYEAHPTAGCNNEACCNATCDILPYCCTLQWDAACAATAGQACPALVDGPTPDFTMDSEDPATRWQKYTTLAPSMKGDVFFDTFGFTGDGFDMAGLETLGQQLIDLYGVGTENLARGKGVRVGVIEHTAYVTGPKVSEGGTLWHEDLNNVIPEPGQTIITIPGGVLNPDHGTGTLGEIVAEDNGFGVTGIAKDAQGYFFPIVSVEEGGRTLNAMFSAMETFEAGDVLNFSIGPGGGGTLVSNAAEWTLVRFGTDKGITSCISAGNDCFNLDDNGQADGMDSGAIIVGACWPGAPDPPAMGVGRFCRLGFSNHCRNCTDDSRVHVAAWGILVTTAGGGDLFGPANPNGMGVDKARTYTSTFNGTSSAAPMVAGLATCLQGLAKQFYGLPLPPAGLRSVIGGNTFPQCDIPNPNALPGSDDQNVCGGDFDPQQQPRLIGGFPRAFEAGIGVITGNFFSGSPVNDVKVVTGTLLFGNANAIKQIDGNYLIVQTVQKTAGAQGTGTPPAINYIAGGQTTDIEVNAFTGILPGDVTGVAVQVVTNATAQYVIMGVYIYNWVDHRWTLIPQIDIAPDGNFNFASVLVNKAPNHVSSDGVVYVRVWTCGLGASPQHKVNHDFVNILISDQPGFDPFGGGGAG